MPTHNTAPCLHFRCTTQSAMFSLSPTQHTVLCFHFSLHSKEFNVPTFPCTTQESNSPTFPFTTQHSMFPLSPTRHRVQYVHFRVYNIKLNGNAKTPSMHRRLGSATLSRRWFSPGKATRISHGRNPIDNTVVESFKNICVSESVFIFVSYHSF